MSVQTVATRALTADSAPWHTSQPAPCCLQPRPADAADDDDGKTVAIADAAHLRAVARRTASRHNMLLLPA
jgi:hypothetical protein